MIKRALLVATVSMLIFAGILWASTFLTTTITMTVSKPITCEQCRFNISLIAGQSYSLDVTILNGDTVNHSVSLTADTFPADLGIVGYKDDGIYNGLIIPALGQITFGYTIDTNESVAESVYEHVIYYDLEY